VNSLRARARKNANEAQRGAQEQQSALTERDHNISKLKAKLAKLRDEQEDATAKLQREVQECIASVLLRKKTHASASLNAIETPPPQSEPDDESERPGEALQRSDDEFSFDEGNDGVVLDKLGGVD
jgi:chromosome segregation ATPase